MEEVKVEPVVESPVVEEEKPKKKSKYVKKVKPPKPPKEKKPIGRPKKPTAERKPRYVKKPRDEWNRGPPVIKKPVQSPGKRGRKKIRTEEEKKRIHNECQQKYYLTNKEKLKEMKEFYLKHKDTIHNV